MRKLLENYKFGFDFWAAVLFALIMLPNIVYWCIPEFNSLGGNGALDSAATVFQVFGVAFLLCVVQKKRPQKLFFDTLFMTATLAVLLYYAAWIVYFCGIVNRTILIFLAVAPCVALILFALERRNWFAFVPLAVFSVLHIVSTLTIAV